MIKNTSLLITLTLVLSLVGTQHLVTVKFSLDDPAFGNFVSEANDYTDTVFEMSGNKSPLDSVDKFYDKFVKEALYGKTAEITRQLLENVSKERTRIQNNIEKLSAQYVKTCDKIGEKSAIIENIGAEIIESANSSISIDSVKKNVEEKVKSLVEFFEDTKKKVENYDFNREKAAKKADPLLALTVEMYPQLADLVIPLYHYEDISQEPAKINSCLEDLRELQRLRDHLTKPLAKTSDLKEIPKDHKDDQVPSDEIQEIKALLDSMLSNLTDTSGFVAEYVKLAKDEDGSLKKSYDSYYEQTVKQMTDLIKELEKTQTNFESNAKNFVANNKDSEMVKDAKNKTVTILKNLIEGLKEIEASESSDLEKTNQISHIVIMALSEAKTVSDFEHDMEQYKGLSDKIHEIKQMSEQLDENKTEEVDQVHAKKQNNSNTEVDEVGQKDKVSKLLDALTALINRKPYKRSVSTIRISRFEMIIKDELSNLQESYFIDGCECDVVTNYPLVLFDSINMNTVSLRQEEYNNIEHVLRRMNQNFQSPFTKSKIEFDNKHITKQVKFVKELSEEFAEESADGKKFKGHKCTLSFYGGDKLNINFGIIERDREERLLLI